MADNHIHTDKPVHINSWPKGWDAYDLGFTLGVGLLVGICSGATLFFGIAGLIVWAVA